MKSRVVFLILVLFLMTQWVSAAGKTGFLELIGVPADQMAGGYNTKTGFFEADLTDIPGAYVQITYDDMVITGKILEWRTKDDYLLVRVDAFLERNNMKINSDVIEYYSEEERMVATGTVRVQTDDAHIVSDTMHYFEAEDRAEFRQNVVVTVEDGLFRGQHFVMYIDEELMQFYGPFAGEFER